MANYKEYRSVSEFPLHTAQLNREQIETAYQDIRNSYKSLVASRGQLVRRQTEAKNSLTTINQSLKQLSVTLEKVQKEKQQLQQALTHSLDVRKQLESWGDELTEQVDDLTLQMSATTKLLEDFESIYEEVKEDNGVFSFWQRLNRLLTAAQRLLNTDIKTLTVKKASPEPMEDWTKETPANINRALRED
ncbi:hypothetical protein [Trichocoleus sp. FACHB-262]|uniref:hypothetical protein n=1 Tax=Trichocoleus sp. FACHB-262 TaxID=2692869 RepID=UPI001683BBD4|nr:hypothetical protein [Trichocoleus sp. FACHB-262]MBD2120686.1 hypothetical protein [Trichocoleus sp. FACHB-262]